MKLTYNAPVTLSYTFLSAAVLGLTSLVPAALPLFQTPANFDFASVGDYFRVFSYILGHANLEHFVGNFSILLLLGPMLEQVHGWKSMIFMILVTAFVTGALNVLIFRSGLYGASGIVFMMILLASFTNAKKGEIPLTFILVVLLYIGKEVFNAFAKADGISQFAHIFGGLCGAIFGFLTPHEGEGAKAKA